MPTTGVAERCVNEERDEFSITYTVQTSTCPHRGCPWIGCCLIVCCAASVWYTSVPVQVLALVCILAAASSWANETIKEGLTLSPGLGVVLFSERRWTGMSEAFVPLEDISGAVINEHVGSCTVHSYLALMTRTTGKLEVAFPNLLPNASQLRRPYQALQTSFLID